MIRIKAPRVLIVPDFIRDMMPRATDDERPYRLYSESMHRRVLALVMACEDYSEGPDTAARINQAVDALAAQAEKEAK